MADLIYLDNNATTAIDPAVLEAMRPYLENCYANPSSGYSFAAEARDAIEQAREQVAALLGCGASEIVFTSGGTESNNTAIHSALESAPEHRHVVTTAVEHSAVRSLTQQLQKRGYEITYLPVGSEGQLSLSQLAEALREDTALLAVMWANNETGVIFPIEEVAQIARVKGVPMLTDAVQAAGKIPIDLNKVSLQFLAISGHKLHAPKGVGALYVHRRARFRPLLVGGSHEENRRAGTSNVASIVALGRAAEIALARMEEEDTRVRELRDQFENDLRQTIPGAHINGGAAPRLPNTCSIRFDGIESDALLLVLDQEKVCCSAGSACRTGSVAPSHVLTAMGLSAEEARSSLRFSFSRFNTASEAEHARGLVAKAVGKLRALSPALIS